MTPVGWRLCNHYLQEIRLLSTLECDGIERNLGGSCLLNPLRFESLQLLSRHHAKGRKEIIPGGRLESEVAIELLESSPERLVPDQVSEHVEHHGCFPIPDSTRGKRVA